MPEVGATISAEDARAFPAKRSEVAQLVRDLNRTGMHRPVVRYQKKKKK